jgi:hypothetical protein
MSTVVASPTFDKDQMKKYQATKGPTCFVIEIDLGGRPADKSAWRLTCNGQDAMEIVAMAGDLLQWKLKKPNNKDKFTIDFGTASPIQGMKILLDCPGESHNYTVVDGDEVGEYKYSIIVGAVRLDPKVIAPGPGNT